MISFMIVYIFIGMWQTPLICKLNSYTVYITYNSNLGLTKLVEGFTQYGFKLGTPPPQEEKTQVIIFIFDIFFGFIGSLYGTSDH